MLINKIFLNRYIPKGVALCTSKSCVHKSFNSFSATVDPNPEVKSFGFRVGKKRKSPMCLHQLKMSLLQLTHDNMEVKRGNQYKSQLIAAWARFKLYI